MYILIFNSLITRDPDAILLENKNNKKWTLFGPTLPQGSSIRKSIWRAQRYSRAKLILTFYFCFPKKESVIKLLKISIYCRFYFWFTTFLFFSEKEINFKCQGTCCLQYCSIWIDAILKSIIKHYQASNYLSSQSK